MVLNWVLEFWLFGIAIVAALGALFHAKITSRQHFNSMRTVADAILAASLASAYTKLHALASAFGITVPALPTLDDWPLIVRTFGAFWLGYGISSVIPNMIDYLNTRFGIKIPWPANPPDVPDAPDAPNHDAPR